jgi:hypothetical protein
MSRTRTRTPLTIPLASAADRALLHRAAEGRSVAAYVRGLIEQDLAARQYPALTPMREPGRPARERPPVDWGKVAAAELDE